MIDAIVDAKHIQNVLICNETKVRVASLIATRPLTYYKA